MRKNLKGIRFLLAVLSFFSVGNILAQDTEKGVSRSFTVTGYYSPLPDQSFYITGDYDSEIRLNGRGIAGADETPVFPGMIAAPESYEFGTKICLENFGCGEVHDRGGAIVTKGKRDLAKHDRLDLWMGFGEAGLLRALAFGVQHIEGKMFSAQSDVAVNVNFHAALPLAQILNLPPRVEFRENLWLGKKGDLVEQLQMALQKLDFYAGEIDGVFDKDLEKAVLNFQIKNFILETASDSGAGRFGPQTRLKLTDVLHKVETQKQIAEKWAEFHFEEDITKGKRSADVLKLQEILVQQEFMDHVPTGYFGKITKAALIEFQEANGLIKNEFSAGAGIVGPKTREKLNFFLSQEQEDFKAEKSQILAYQKNRSQLHYFAGKSLTQKQLAMSDE